MDSSPSDLSKIAGPESMAAPQRNGNAPYGGGSGVGSSSQSRPQQSSTSQSQQQQQQQQQGSTSNGVDGGASTTVMSKKKRHRAGKKRRNRRQSFIAPSETGTEIDTDQRPSILDANRASAEQTSFYRLKSAARSNTSLESEALLDHRSVFCVVFSSSFCVAFLLFHDCRPRLIHTHPSTLLYSLSIPLR